MAGALVENLKLLENGIITYDAFFEDKCLCVGSVIRTLCDNARDSELTNHLGSKAKKFCRICMVRYHVFSMIQNINIGSL